MSEEDIRIIKGVAAMLEYIAAGSGGVVKYSDEAFGLLAGQLMEVIERNEES